MVLISCNCSISCAEYAWVAMHGYLKYLCELLLSCAHLCSILSEAGHHVNPTCHMMLKDIVLQHRDYPVNSSCYIYLNAGNWDQTELPMLHIVKHKSWELSICIVRKKKQTKNPKQPKQKTPKPKPRACSLFFLSISLHLLPVASVPFGRG